MKTLAASLFCFDDIELFCLVAGRIFPVAKRFVVWALWADRNGILTEELRSPDLSMSSEPIWPG